MAETEQSAPKAEVVAFKPPSAVNPADLAAAFEAEGIIEPKAAAPEAKVAAAPAAAPAPDDGLPALMRRARESSEKRAATSAQEVEQAKPYLEALKVLSPTQAQTLAKAVQMGDPVGVLTALGMTHAQYNARLLGTKDPSPVREDAKPVDELSALKQKVAELEGGIRNKETQSVRQQALSKMSDVLKGDPKFQLVTEFNKLEDVERVIMDHWSRNGQQLPGKDFEETVRLAAEVVEYELQQEKAKWSRVLTPSPVSASVPAQKAPEHQPSTGTVTPRTLTNANASAPAAARPVPPTRQEIIDALISGNDEFLES